MDSATGAPVFGCRMIVNPTHTQTLNNKSRILSS